jgi:hypothetical protein
MWKARSTLPPLLSIAALFIIAPDARGATSELETLRQELQKTQADFQKLLEMQHQTQRKMEELQQKLEAIEAGRPTAPATTQTPSVPGQTPAPRTAAAPEPPEPPQTTPQAPQGGGLPSLVDLLRPREPFAPYRERGPGQFLFDMGVVGDFVGDFTPSRFDHSPALPHATASGQYQGGRAREGVQYECSQESPCRAVPDTAVLARRL